MGPSVDGPPTTRSLLLTILGEFVLGTAQPVWNAALLRALAAFGVADKTARQTISRSAADGWLKREKLGRQVRWHLTPFARRLLTDGAERIFSFSSVAQDWDGRWLLVRVSVGEDQRDLRHQARTQLAWEGFGTLGQGWWISPHVGRREEIVRLAAGQNSGGEAPPVMTLVVEPGSVAEEQALVDEAWGDREQLQAAYAHFIAEEASPGDAEDTFRAVTRLVHDWRAFPFDDPGLPRHLLPADWIGERAARVFAERHERWAPTANDWFLTHE